MVFKPANKYHIIWQCHNFKNILFDYIWTQTHNHLVCKGTLNHFPNSQMIELCCEYLSVTVHLTVSFYHVTYIFQSESTLYSCLNVKELLAVNRCETWSLSDCNWTQSHNHLVQKWTLHHLATLAKWLRSVVSTYLYGAFDCIFLCHICVSECWVFVYELSGCGFKSSCSQLNFRFHACFKQGVLWHSGN